MLPGAACQRRPCGISRLRCNNAGFPTVGVSIMKTGFGLAMSLFLVGSATAQTTPLTAEYLAVASQVQVGTLPCELGQTVVLLAEPGQLGHFSLRLGKATYRMAPELTTTGAVRLEDKASGIVWLQLANKSMLMNQKLGRRMADECKSTVQLQVAQEMLRNPPPSVLDDSKPATALVRK